MRAYCAQTAGGQFEQHAALAAEEFVPFIGDQPIQVFEEAGVAFCGEQHVQTFRRGDEQMRQLFLLCGAFLLFGVAGA